MELRNYTQIAKRYRWLLVVALLIGASFGFLAHRQRTPVYEATAKVLLLPNNPLERLQPSTENIDPDRHAAIQINVMLSDAVLDAAAKAIPGSDAGSLAHQVSVEAEPKSGILFVHARDPSAARARDMANAVPRAYIENRRLLAVSSLQKAADQVTVRLDALKARLASTTGASQESNAEVQATTQQYLTLYSRQQDLLIEISLKKGEAELIGPAQRPTTPTGPSRAVSAVLGALVALVGALGLAVLGDHLDDRVRSREELERISELPVLAEMPVDRQSGHDAGFIATADSPLSSVAEATRLLRTSINFLGVSDDEPIKQIVVTSAQANDGKTMVAANLAAAYAQAGYQTVLVSADLRRPRLEELFGVDGDTRGLTDALFPEAAPGVRAVGAKSASAGGAERPGRRNAPAFRAADAVAAAVRPTRVPNLSLLPAGAIPPNPAEILGSTRIDELLEFLWNDFDMTIIDTTPLLAVTDAAVLAQKVGNVLLVASLMSTRRRAIAHMASAAWSTHARVLGVVLNRVPASQTGYLAGYYDPPPKRMRRRGRRRTPAPADLGTSLPSLGARPTASNR